MSWRAKTYVRGHLALLWLGIGTGLLVALELFSGLHLGIADLGAPLGLLLVFVLVPIGLPLLWIVKPREPDALSPRSRRMASLTKIGLIPLWVLSVFPMMIWAAIVQPWPVSLMQGPNTDFAREGFRRHAREPVPSSVEGVYYKRDGGWQDTHDKLRFEFTDPATIDAIVARLELGTEKPELLMFDGPAPQAKPRWWRHDAPEQLRRLDCGDGRWGTTLWVDDAGGVAYLRYFDY